MKCELTLKRDKKLTTTAATINKTYIKDFISKNKPSRSIPFHGNKPIEWWWHLHSCCKKLGLFLIGWTWIALLRQC